MATPQEIFEGVLQEQSDLFDLFKEDNKEILRKLPIEEIARVISQNPEDLEAAIGIGSDWMESNILPILEEQISKAQLQAVETTIGLQKSLK